LSFETRPAVARVNARGIAVGTKCKSKSVKVVCDDKAKSERRAHHRGRTLGIRSSPAERPSAHWGSRQPRLIGASNQSTLTARRCTCCMSLRTRVDGRTATSARASLTIWNASYWRT